MNEQVKNIFKQNIIVDGLFHAILKDPPPECGIGKDIVDMILDGGVNCISNSVLDDVYPFKFIDLCHEIYDHFLLQDVIPEKLLVVDHFDDILKAKKEGKLALILSTQGTDSLQGDVRLVSLAYKLGIRIMQITYNYECALGSGAYATVDNGLTHYGRQVITEMNRVGMVIDVSHVGQKTAMQAIERSEKPVIYSHSGVKAIANHVRNVSDDHIRAIKRNGGVVGLCPHCVFTTDAHDKRPTVEDFINAMLHVANITGSMDNIGIGTDRWSRDTMGNSFKKVGFERTTRGFFGGFDSNSKHVEGFNYYDEWENLASRMLARGISEEDIAKVLGGNLLRVYKANWR